MLRYSGLLTILLICISFQNADAQWKPLFNRDDFSGWDTYLRSSEGSADTTPIGFNKDPHGVFAIHDGIIHISGQDWGAIISKKDYSNYHLRFRVKFGEKKWPPREQLLRDGGLMFHSSGPQNYGYRCWMRSNEMQIQETEIGDFYNAGEGTCEFAVLPTTVKGEEKDSERVEQYDPNGIMKRYDDRVYHAGNFENPHGEWTTGEMIARGADAVFIVNGVVVNRLFNTYRKDLQAQTSSGRLQFQSESAEYFLKDIEIRPVDFRLSGRPLLAAAEKTVQVSAGTAQKIIITNSGAATELVAVELIGRNIERIKLQLPAMPFVLSKGGRMEIPVSLKAGAQAGGEVKLRLETVLGPIPGFEITLAPVQAN